MESASELKNGFDMKRLAILNIMKSDGSRVRMISSLALKLSRVHSGKTSGGCRFPSDCIHTFTAWFGASLNRKSFECLMTNTPFASRIRWRRPMKCAEKPGADKAERVAGG
jgi:hypothetical protein